MFLELALFLSIYAIGGNFAILNKITEKQRELNFLPESEAKKIAETYQNSFAYHNIKNAAINLEWAIKALNLSPTDTENLQGLTKQIHTTLEDLRKFNEAEQQLAFYPAELQNMLEKLVFASFKTNAIIFRVDFPDTSLVFKQALYPVFLMFNNLVINAVKAVETCQEKEILVSAHFEADKGIFKICDTGIGIPPELQTKIFQPTFSTTGGTGFGLAYVQSKITEIKGRVYLEKAPKPFKTVFVIEIPYTK